jgi:hypothetical protein
MRECFVIEHSILSIDYCVFLVTDHSQLTADQLSIAYCILNIECFFLILTPADFESQ